jgi:hypothetical protein
MFALPPIGAVGPSGPQDCFDRDSFVDFMSLTTQRNVQSGHSVEWTSTPTIPGFDGNTGTLIMNTHYFSPTFPPGCYLISAEERNGDNEFVGESSVMIRIKAFPSDPCEPCEGAPGGGGSGGGTGGGDEGDECIVCNPTGSGGGAA